MAAQIFVLNKLTLYSLYVSCVLNLYLGNVSQSIV